MRAALEKIEPGFGSSFTLRSFERKKFVETPFWHFHPEMEIVYISNGKGKRHIGNNISYYEDGDLVLLGSSLPHSGFTDRMEEEHHEVVIQMKEDFMGKDFFNRPELSHIQKLFERSAHGIYFYGKTKEQVGTLIKEMEHQHGFKRLMTLLEVLNVLATSRNYTSLNASQLTFEVNSQDYDRVQKIYNHVEHHFLDHIALEEMAALINMTVPAFCRYFKKLTGKTFTQFVNEFRVDYACKLLSEPENTIANICFESGFNNISHFNKQFKQIAGVTPRQYRYKLKKVVAHNTPSNQLEYEEKV